MNKICLCCGKEQNREICWDCWGDYIKIAKKSKTVLDVVYTRRININELLTKKELEEKLLKQISEVD